MARVLPHRDAVVSAQADQRFQEAEARCVISDRELSAAMRFAAQRRWTATPLCDRALVKGVMRQVIAARSAARQHIVERIEDLVNAN